MDESKVWNLTQGSVRHEQDTVKTVLEEDQKTEDRINQNEEPPDQNVQSSTRTRIESKRILGYERFSNQTIDADGEFIEEMVIMVESEPINLDQDMINSNWLASMQ